MDKRTEMSEPPTKLPLIFGRPQYQEIETFEFYVKLCSDVIMELLPFGDRRRLTKLERVGKHIHRLVENYFGVVPFLRLDIRLSPGNIYGLKAFIGIDGKNISLANLVAFPPFLRFDEVRLQYEVGQKLLLAKCLLFEECLNSIKPALKDSNKISFVASIDKDNSSHFSDHSSVVIYLRYGLLPISCSSRHYTFIINLESDEYSGTDLLESIFQIFQVQRCSNVSILLDLTTKLPVEDISNWLIPKTDDSNLWQTKNKVLNISLLPKYSRDYMYLGCPNIKEMWDHLKEKFYKAKRPEIPFTFRINYEDLENDRRAEIIEEEKFLNLKTNEELSIAHDIVSDSEFVGYIFVCTEIKRTVKQEQNSHQ